MSTKDNFEISMNIFFFSQMKENMLSPLTIVKFSSHVSSKCIRLSFYIFEILLTSLFGI